ncbi:MAG: hypothetical protein JWP12_132 [Bacteroidetes bacterium]|nr:hypothetical protein [Bacteroidota bacterium]
MKNFTKKMKLIGALLILVCAGKMNAQTTFNYLTPYDSIVQTPDTLHWAIPTTAANAFGTVSITLYYQGDFGASSEFVTIYGETGSALGVSRPYFDGNDCMEDSVTFTFPASQIGSWIADDTLKFSGVTSDQVDYFCTANHMRMKLTYSYCPLGGPIAMLTSPVSAVCGSDGLITLNSSPAGGTLSGINTSGANMFNPNGLTPGIYTLTYTYTNSDGCTSNSAVDLTIKEGPVATALADTLCTGTGTTLNVTGNGHMVWYADAGLTTALDSGATYTTPALSTTTTFYAATTLIDNYFQMNTLSGADSIVIDHDSITGDDRGGIAVTNNYLYMVGDDYTGRFDLSLGSATRFPRMDGLVSDLNNGKLYTLYNPTVGIPDANNIDRMVITQLHTLNADLTLGTDSIILSDSIAFGWDSTYDFQSGVFAGNGFIIIYSAPVHSWYVIDMRDGVVTNLGTLADPGFYGSETWASWGVAEFNGTSYSVLYQDYNNYGSISRRVLPDNAITVVYAFTDLSDMSSFTYAPWNNRLYMHYEGSAYFGGDSETLVALDATDVSGPLTGGAHINCAAAVTVTVDVCTGIKEKAKGEMSVYPNPNNGVFTISFSDNMANSKVEIMNMEGRLVYSAVLKGADTKKDVDLTGLAKGVYYVRISNDVDVLTEKLVKY